MVIHNLVNKSCCKQRLQWKSHLSKKLRLLRKSENFLNHMICLFLKKEFAELQIWLFCVKDMSLEPSELVAAFMSKISIFRGLGLGVFYKLEACFYSRHTSILDALLLETLRYVSCFLQKENFHMKINIITPTLLFLNDFNYYWFSITYSLARIDCTISPLSKGG